ncbi:MAG: shikimate kinase [Actinomycetota bacterium]
MGRLSRPATVALIGPMGAGKTEVGRRLAQLLGRSFRDTDRMVEHKTSNNIADLFQWSGETEFRRLEATAIKEASQTAGAVIACGGGAIVDPANVAALRSGGVVVYLKVSLELAVSRVRSGKGRPLLEGGDVPSKLAGLLKDRETAYVEAADYIVDADGTVESVVSAVMLAIGKTSPHLGSASASPGSV